MPRPDDIAIEPGFRGIRAGLHWTAFLVGIGKSEGQLGAVAVSVPLSGGRTTSNTSSALQRCSAPVGIGDVVWSLSSCLLSSTGEQAGRARQGVPSQDEAGAVDG
jgi:hypothetical protein